MKNAPLALLLFVVAIGCDGMKQATEPRPKEVDYFAKKRECMELAVKRQTRDEQAAAKANIPGFADVKTEQCYVPSMNTCIYESGTLYLKTFKTSMTVEDLLTGRDLAGGPGDDPTYKQERDRLFALCAK
jgi:hypothetical protein